MIFFTDDMKVGITSIDLQHKALTDFANRIDFLFAANPSKEEMKKSLDFLGNYVIQHFGDEENLQLETNYPRYREHKEIHREFVETFVSICREFDKHGSSKDLFGIIAKRVSNWIVTHIKMEDVKFGEYYAEYIEGHLDERISRNE